MNITKSEQKILNLLWEEGSLSTMQIVEKLEEETGWSKHAVISFLKKMEAKGLVRYEEKGRAKYYSPMSKKEAVAKEERTSFLKNFYGGRLGLMVTAMAEDHSLSREDIKDLRKLLDDLQKDND
ncbi:MAG: BlaI/MecI/CopY family transcriptional regulator [Lachnospiraceae bacterium]|nr:BlaI/MecI/CopY family transcriptional regulator [Lachnospiraceae bacterium]